MIDQNNDTTFSSLRALLQTYPAIRPHIKTASVGEEVRESLPPSAFADRANRRFPVHTSADAILSKAYATKVANLAVGVQHEIDTALEMYNVSPDMFQETKVASVLQEEPTYLLEGQSKLAMYSDTSIKAAEEALYRNKNKLAPQTLSGAAVKLVKEARRRNEEVSTQTLKYAGLVQCDPKHTMDWLEVRAHKATAPSVANGFKKLAQVVKAVDSSVSRDDLIKVSTAITQLDKIAGFTKYYGRRLPDPVDTVFNTKTAMQPMLELGGKQVPMEKLLAIPPETYGDILGSDIVGEISEGGEIMPDALGEVLETLPKDMKDSLVQELNL
tara:strand:- start:464 stop:1447 length:984 start_codon:yes stop_codon:yes gene_type:complete